MSNELLIQAKANGAGRRAYSVAFHLADLHDAGQSWHRAAQTIADASRVDVGTIFGAVLFAGLPHCDQVDMVREAEA